MWGSGMWKCNYAWENEPLILCMCTFTLCLWTEAITVRKALNAYWFSELYKPRVPRCSHWNWRFGWNKHHSELNHSGLLPKETSEEIARQNNLDWDVNSCVVTRRMSVFSWSSLEGAECMRPNRVPMSSSPLGERTSCWMMSRACSRHWRYFTMLWTQRAPPNSLNRAGRQTRDRQECCVVVYVLYSTTCTKASSQKGKSALLPRLPDCQSWPISVRVMWRGSDYQLHPTPPHSSVSKLFSH